MAAFAGGLPADAVVLGHGWDESRWARPVPPDAAELDRAAGGRRVYLSQASMHSALVSQALLAAAPQVAAAAGFDASGWLRRDAHHVVRAVAMGSVPSAQRRQRSGRRWRTRRRWGSRRCTSAAARTISSEDDFTVVAGALR